MIKLIDATTLALTKLRTHKIRTTITILIPSLLFGVLFAILITSEGAFDSIANFNKEGYGSHFFVKAEPAFLDEYRLLQDPGLIARAKQIYKETIASKKAVAKEIGITFDESSEENSVINYSGKAGDEQLSATAPSAIQAYSEYKATHNILDDHQLKDVASPYHPTGIYAITPKMPKNGSVNFMKDGKENFALQDLDEVKNDYGLDYSNISSVISNLNGFTVVDNELAKPFLLKNTTTPTDENSIPVIIAYNVAENLLKLPKLDNKASQSEQLNRVKDIQDQASSISFSVCYRNDISNQLISETIATASEIEKNKTNRNYVAPPLIYQLPAEDSCSAPTVKTDTRSSEDKALAVKIKKFNDRFGINTEPDQQKIAFHVVGLMPNGPDYSNFGITPASIIQQLVGSNLDYGLIVPSETYGKLPSLTRFESIFAKPEGMFIYRTEGRVVEFASSTDASKFINDKSCNTGDPQECLKQDRPYWLYGYGSNSIALDSMKKSFLKVFSVAILVVAGIAIIIMTGTIGRMVADGRRETAVFRAIGFKRIDIVSIYTAYSIIISLFIVLASFTIGATTASILDSTYWQEFTLQSLLAFGASDMSKEFHLFKLNYAVIAMVSGAIIASGIVSSIIPLARNIRRNPIKDMRDE